MTQEYIAKGGGRFTEHAAPGVHALAVDMLGVGKSARVMDVPSGGGALAQRMVDQGFSDVTCGDIVNGLPAGCGLQFLQVDLNAKADQARQFDAILCIECIEHLENPYHLLRTLASWLSPGGELIISTPNVMSAAARSKFLTAGYFPYFSELAYRWDELRAQKFMGHVMPVPATMMLYAAEQAGFRFSDLKTNGHIRRPGLKDRLIASLVRLGSRRHYSKPVYVLLTSETVLFGDVLIFKFIKQ